MIDLVDVQQVAPRVLARLKQLATLPDHGVVAGQSVASLIYEELGLPISGALNDIDVFVSHKLPADKRGVVYTNDGTPKKIKPRKSSFTQWKSMVSTQKQVHTDNDDGEDYKFLNIIGQRGSISVLRTYRCDLVNYTLVTGEGMGPGGFVNVQVAQGLVNGFDLNCVAVGIDLYTGRLVCTDNFIEFLNTYQLKPQSYHTPGYTLIRLAKKIFGDSMSGITCDFEKEKEILLCGSDIQKSNIWRHHQDGEHLYTFGPKYAEILKPFVQHLPAMVESIHDDFKLWSFAENSEHAKFKEIQKGFSETSSNNMHFARGILYTKHLGAIWDLDPSTRTQLFADLKSTESDHYKMLCAVKTPTVITDKAFLGHTLPEMQMCMSNNSLSLVEQEEIVTTRNAWSVENRILFDHFKGELHELVLYQHNPLEFYKQKFLEMGPEFFQKFGVVDKAVLHYIYPKIMEFATTTGRDTVRRAMEQRNFFSLHFYCPLPVPQKDFMNHLINIALGPDLLVQQNDNTKMVSNIVRWLVNQEQPIPPLFPSLHASRALRKISYTDIMQENPYSEYATGVLSQLLTFAQDPDLKNIYILELIKSGGQNLLETRLMAMDNEAFEELKTFNYEKITDYLGGYDLDAARETMKVFFERISLNKAVAHSSTPTKSVRKM